MRSTSIAGWLDAFLSRRELDAPDGKPLFTYRVTDEELDQLCGYVRGHRPGTTYDAAAFCLYAAEWWRRNGKGFRWEGLLESLEVPAQYVELYDSIERGLRYWRREVRCTQHGRGVQGRRRDFVGTLSREGGLPMQLLLREGNSVRRFFRALLNERYATGDMSVERAQSLGHILPEAWRHQDIFELAADMVATIWTYRDAVRDADEPIATLDHVQPQWRREFPVRIDSEVAEALVCGLVVDAHEIAGARRPPLMVETRLAKRGELWALERLMEPPRKIRRDWLAALLGLAPDVQIPNRLRLIVEDEGAPRLIAVANQWDLTKPFGIEMRVSSPVRIHGTGEVELRVEAGDRPLGRVLLRGGEELAEQPWIFVPQEGSNPKTTYELAGQGSARLRARILLLALPSGARVVSENGAPCREVGSIRTGDAPRLLVSLEAGVVVIEAGGERYEVEASAPKEELWAYRLKGPALAGTTGRGVWHGTPELVMQSASGLLRPIASQRLKWRPSGSRGPWRPMSPQCCGEVELRYAPEGITHFRKAARVVPPDVLIELTAREAGNEGGLRISGAQNARAELIAGDGFVARRCDVTGIHEWTVQTIGAPPAALDVRMLWGEDRSLKIRVPYPVVGIRFVDRHGRVLPEQATVAVENLPGTYVEAILPRHAPEPRIEASVHKSGGRFQRGAEFWRSLRQVRSGRSNLVQRYALDLSELDEDVRLRLSCSTEMNAQVTLRVRSRLGGEAAIHVRRFPVALWADPNADTLEVLADKSEPFLGQLLDRLVVSAFPVTEPAGERALLPPISETQWSLASLPKDEGAWLLVGHREGSSCARPVIYAPPQAELGPPPEEPPPAPTLEAAVRLPWRTTRERTLRELLKRMVRDPTHPEWPHLVPYIETLGELPATTFDVVDAMAENPASCVYGLLAGQAKLEFRDLWSAFEELPFMWELVGVQQWIDGVRTWWKTYLLRMDALEDSVRDQMVEVYRSTYANTCEQLRLRAPGFSLIHELIARHVFGDRLGSGSSLTNMLAHPSGAGRRFLLDDRKTALQELLRRHADSEWPISDATRVVRGALLHELPDELAILERFDTRLRRDQISVSCAPVLAALASTSGFLLRQEQIFAIRQLKAFDLNWFQRCYDTTLATAVGTLLERDAEHYR